MDFKEYPSYKNSGVEWLGDVPEHWQQKPIWSLFKRIKRTNFPTERLLSVYRDYGVIPKDSRDDNHNRASEDLTPYQLVCANDLVINKMKAWQGSIAISELRGIVSPAYYIYQPKAKYHSKYIHFLIRSAYYIQSYKNYSKGIRVNQWDLESEAFTHIDLLLPSLDEQQKIVAFLDTETTRIDNLIAKQEKLIELLEEQRKSIISHAVTKGLNPNAPMKDSGVEWLGEVPESWVEQKIKFISKLINEKTSEKSNVIALENIESWTGKYIETESSFESDAVKFKKNDVLFGKLRPYLAKVYLVENQGEAVGDIYVLRPNKLIHPQFLKFFMLSEKFIDYVNSSTNGTKMPRANWDFIGCIPIFLPHIKVQHEIVEYLESAVLKIELIINKQISLIEKLEEYRSSIISHAVTGKIDIREFC
ncbi:TPA: restriction endonuclease subunit S [Acinetobacter baumannii]|uniref:restriction endonuclease subunit S n=1 Tax=Acinetobacter calcoaceticus/baumannii complex TaxID=909768 RepID=UPI000CE4180A|nr:restriction endonuclease subunit S [Acinetobacter baumannii]MDC5240593.1 restriction endonuclease subunit S [Acinetobacter baumannii]PPB91382.1 type I restriction endonuclease subunit S [Acinetobacter baumannii]PPC07340.1 type I restriction endonuclease subunit S [Acinetobacter baumannii]PPC15876.1 type I restriction endonuclease subunit S [Acinetobacter baumannii]HEM7137960.1 restriction endonuclease subunit S [Acinetobacter baumannii]